MRPGGQGHLSRKQGLSRGWRQQGKQPQGTKKSGGNLGKACANLQAMTEANRKGKNWDLFFTGTHICTYLQGVAQ